jgi:hypothetical protein
MGHRSRYLHRTYCSIANLAIEYEFLRERQAQALAMRDTLARNGDYNAETKNWERRADLAARRMYTKAWQLARERARRKEEVRAKATILLDWCSKEPGDLFDALAASLCSDVMHVIR